MPSDYNEMKDVNDATKVSDISSSEPQLTNEGISAMQGKGDDSAETEKLPEPPPASDSGAENLATIHPQKSPEVLPNVEAEPIATIRNPEGGAPQPPEGWRPGRIESRG